MAQSLPVKIRRTEFASSDPDELREVIDRGFGSRLQLAVPRRRGWRATVSQVDAGYFTSLLSAVAAGVPDPPRSSWEFSSPQPASGGAQRRLDHAHRDLLAADPASRTVTAIAYRRGFSNASRFATRYQEAYGVRPSQTLRQD